MCTCGSEAACQLSAACSTLGDAHALRSLCTNGTHCRIPLHWRRHLHRCLRTLQPQLQRMFCRRNTTCSLHFPVRTPSTRQLLAFTPHSLQHWHREKHAQLQQQCACTGKPGRRHTVQTCAALPSLPGKKDSLLYFKGPVAYSKPTGT